MHSDQFKPKSYLKLNKKYVFSEGEEFLLRTSLTKTESSGKITIKARNMKKTREKSQTGIKKRNKKQNRKAVKPHQQRSAMQYR